MKYNIFFYLYQYPSFRTFFSRIRIRIFPDRIRILADQDPDPDSEKRSDPDPDPGKKTQIRNTGKNSGRKGMPENLFYSIRYMAVRTTE